MFLRRKLLSFISILVILTILFSSIPMGTALAQGKDGLKRQVNPQTGRVSFLGPENGTSLSAAQALGGAVPARPADPAMALAKRFGPEFGLTDPERDLSPLKAHREENGRITARYQQSYQGIPVMAGELIVNTDDSGDLYSMNGEVSPGLSLSTQPTIDSETAKQTALQAAADWYQKAPEDFQVSEAELWIFDESLLRPSTRPAELVWRMEVKPKDIGMPVRELVLVNAQRGDISLHFNQVDTGWSSSRKNDTSQDVQPTSTPQPTETPLPTETLEPIATEVPADAAESTEDASVFNALSDNIGPLAPTTWYVATTGNDSNSCSSAGSPCQTINAAIGKAAAGDTILIAEGTYFSNNPSGSPRFQIYNKPLTLSGGWNTAFSSQSGSSILDGKKEGTVLYIAYNANNNVSVDHLIMQNGISGLAIEGSANVSIRQSGIYGNSDRGIYLWSGNFTLENSTVSGNRNTGIYNPFGGTVNIINSTITGNSSSGNPSTGGIFGNSTFIQNSILSGNTKDGTQSDCYGTITSLGNNIIGTTSGCSLTPQSSDLVGVNPQISDFLGSGYHALFSNSPAIDTGNASACPASDQRGISRPAGVKCDIGAYEYTVPGSAGKVIVQSGAYQLVGLNAPLGVPLKALVLDAVGSPVAGKSVTFIAPGSGASGIFAGSGTNQSTAVTDANGIASASIFTTNMVAGSYNITASVSGISETAKFPLTNIALYVKPDGNNNLDCLTPATACSTINAAIGKAQPNSKVLVAGGTYTGSVYEVVSITKNISLSGGWNTSFTTQNQQSIIDGQNVRNGIDINSYGGNDLNVSLDNFIIKNSGEGLKTYLATVTLLNSALLNNRDGVNNQGTLTVTNVTASGNSNYGIANFRTLTIQNSTIANNTSGIYNTASTNIQNSILANNGTTSSPSNCNILAGTITSTGYNIISSTSGCSMTTQVTDLVGVDALISPLFGGGFYPLFGNSPAINAANSATCPATDQRGVVRPIGPKCDIGSFEYRGGGTTPAYSYAIQGTPQTIEPGSIALTPIKVAVLDQNGDSVSGASVTFTAPASGASGTFANTNTNVSTAVTDAGGIATASNFTANNMHGSYIIKAAVGGLVSYVDFQIVNGAPKVKTYTANSGTTLPGGFLCDQTQPNCTNGSNPHADTAHKYAIGVYNFYATQFGRDSFDNRGMTIISTVHYGSGYDNAEWNGEQMVYGDKSGWPLADDVVAHEFTHGVTQYESNLFYYYQSGAINESFSDLWGEYYDQTNGVGTDTAAVKWKISEDILPGGTGAIRDMSNPPAFGDPDKMSSPNYFEGDDDSGGVHYNSGVNNKAVYLMVDGGTFNGRTVTALGWDKTAAIYYEANINLLSSGADYFDLYYALQQACTNLIGQKGITAGDCAEVKDALDAVEMYLQRAPSFNVDAPYCDAGNPVTTVFADDLEAGTGNWTFTNGAYPRWQLDIPNYGPFAQSGLHSLYADDYPDVVADASARLKSIAVPNNAYLRFAQAYEFETGYNPGDPTFYNFDGGVLEYSINNGASWVDAGSLIDANGYRGTLFTGAKNPLSGRSAFVGSSHGYISTRLNLYPLVGQTVTFRWRMGLDEAGSYGGWWVDNVSLYTCPVILSKDTTGVFRPSNGLLYLKNTNKTGFADVALNYGIPGDYPVVGDWDGDGDATIGVYRNGKFMLRNSNTIGFADMVFAFGVPGDQPVAGDWDGDGVDTIGVYRPSTGLFLLRNSNSAGNPDKSFYLGNVGDVGIAGDWDGDGKDTTGVFRPINGIIFLKNTNETGYADVALNYGIPGDKPVTGDWNDDGIDTIGVYRKGQFLLRNSNTVGFADIAFGLGIPGDMPIAGNWDALP